MARIALILGLAALLLLAALATGRAASAEGSPVEEVVRYDRAPIENEPVEVDPVVQRGPAAPADHRTARRDWKRYIDCRGRQFLALVPKAKKRQHASKREVRNCRRNLAKNRRLYSRDFHKVLAWAADRFGVSYSWLHACVHDEGGHGPAMIWNTDQARRGIFVYYGPGQFHPGTYTRMATGAYQALRASGLRLPQSFFFDPARPNGRPDTMYGQAVAMAHGFSQGRSIEWEGAAC